MHLATLLAALLSPAFAGDKTSVSPRLLGHVQAYLSGPSGAPLLRREPALKGWLRLDPGVEMHRQALGAAARILKEEAFADRLKSPVPSVEEKLFLNRRLAEAAAVPANIGRARAIILAAAEAARRQASAGAVSAETLRETADHLWTLSSLDYSLRNDAYQAARLLRNLVPTAPRRAPVPQTVPEPQGPAFVLPPGVSLSDRHKKTLEYLVAGLENRDIGTIAGLEERTIKAHCRAIFDAFGISGKGQREKAAVAVVLGLPKPPAKALPSLVKSGAPPTARQREVLQHVVDGRTNPQIAIKMNTTENVVKNLLRDWYETLEIETRTRLAVVLVMEYGFRPAPSSQAAPAIKRASSPVLDPRWPAFTLPTGVSLGQRQALVLQQLIAGFSYKKIAMNLRLRPGTVSAYAQAVYKALGVSGPGSRRKAADLVRDPSTP